VALYATIPAISILLFGIVSFLTNAETQVRFNIVSSVATSVTLLFLISERLRESVRRKLDFLNKKALTPAYSASKSDIAWAADYKAKTLVQCKELLRHHGKYLQVRLYPKKLLKALDITKGNLISYDELNQRVVEAGNKSMGPNFFNVGALFVALGLAEKGNYTDEMVDKHRQFLNSLRKNEPHLEERFKGAYKIALKGLGEIKRLIEAFFAENQLEELQERGPFG